MEKKIKLWTRDELIVTFNLYLKLPFGKLDARTKEVIHLANILGRTAGSVSMRLNNFASVDPYHQDRGIRGLMGGIKQVQPIWDEFFNDKDLLLFNSEKILAEKEEISLEVKFANSLKGTEHLKGEDKIREVKTRVNQSAFRQIVMGNYDGKCAITGIDISELLVASHIIPWSKNEKERLNPENGICLCSLYDRAYDKGYIGINHKLELLLSTDIKNRSKEPYYLKYFASLIGSKITTPRKYNPNKEFLDFHLDTIFRR